MRAWGISLGAHAVLLLLLAMFVISGVVVVPPEDVTMRLATPAPREETPPPMPTPPVTAIALTLDPQHNSTNQVAELAIERSTLAAQNQAVSVAAPAPSRASAAFPGGGAPGDPALPTGEGPALDFSLAYGGTQLPGPPAGPEPTARPPVSAQPTADPQVLPGTSADLGQRLDQGFRTNALERFGGSAASEQAVRLGLDWLCRKQEPDGRWSARRWGGFSLTKRHDMHEWLTREQAEEAFDIGVTGLAVLAFLGAGITERDAPERLAQYQVTVRKGLDWLCARQQASGEWPGSMYGHAIATLAMAEAYGMTGQRQSAAARGVSWILRSQNPFGGWNYHPTAAKGGSHRNDTSITGWAVMALKSARMANLPLNLLAFRKAEGFFRAVGAGGPDYRQPVVYARAADGAIEAMQSPRSGNLAVTAIAMVSLEYLGWSGDQPFLQAKAAQLLAAGPSFENLYYTYYATLALFQIGGETWERWNAALRDPLLARQDRGNTDNNGSWDPQPDRWGEQGGRAYITALAVMCLEVYYRYLPLYEREGH